MPDPKTTDAKRWEWWRTACAEADDRAQAAVAEVERLRAALRRIVSVPEHRQSAGHLHDCAWCNGSAEIAREALAHVG